MRILLVENDPDSAAAVKAMLQDVAADCVWAESGMTALSLAQAEEFDLILLDLMLPDIDGYEIVRRLQSADIETPFLILSGLIDRDSQFAAMTFGVSDYLVKPFSRNELIGRIRSVIDRAGGNDSLNVDEIPALKNWRHTDGKDRRKLRRLKTLRSARIDYGDGIPCRVINMSHTGAGLRLMDETERIPRSFMLMLESGEHHLCRVAWRNGDRMGVKFIDSHP